MDADRLGVAMTSLRIVVADDQASVREGLALMLDLLPDIEVVGTAADGAQTLELVGSLHPDAVLLDLHMPVMDGTETARRLSAEHPDVAIVVLTTYADDASVLGALHAGARGYLTKDADRLDIARALHSAARGLAVVDREVHQRLLAAATRESTRLAPADRTDLPDNLTPREAEVLAMIAEGASNSEIAERLVVSGHTVKSHINRIFAKTGSRDRASAIVYAHRHGLG
jgi:DNA-binding NarL/FixJ family response regulator